MSRSAFFAGQVAPAGKPAPKTGDDPKRWRDNKDLAKLLGDGDMPQLLLRGESHTGDGSANAEALALVASTDRRIVAIVINAIDASLKADSQQHQRWTAESIRSLRDLLDRARDAGRAVLLASDHGHVPSDRLTFKAGTVPQGGARYRPWEAPNDPVQPYEIAVAGAGVYAPKGAHGVVMLADERSRYGSGPTAGEHGGATLAEVLAPCVLMGCEQASVLDDDPGQRMAAPHVPAWWHLDLRDEVVSYETKPTPRRRPRRSRRRPPPSSPCSRSPSRRPHLRRSRSRRAGCPRRRGRSAHRSSSSRWWRARSAVSGSSKPWIIWWRGMGGVGRRLRGGDG
ncbi:MAG: hypothetical protein R3B72_37875 [Polyangiaceae bacterium]